MNLRFEPRSVGLENLYIFWVCHTTTVIILHKQIVENTGQRRGTLVFLSTRALYMATLFSEMGQGIFSMRQLYRHHFFPSPFFSKCPGMVTPTDDPVCRSWRSCPVLQGFLQVTTVFPNGKLKPPAFTCAHPLSGSVGLPIKSARCQGVPPPPACTARHASDHCLEGLSLRIYQSSSSTPGA